MEPATATLPRMSDAEREAFERDGYVRLPDALPAAERSNLKLSSRLLSVAWHVQKGN